MNIYEAIEHCKEVAKENRNAALEFARVNQYDAARDCVACGEEHEQLAKWLEELEWRREQPEARNGRWVLKTLPIVGGAKIRAYLCSECERYVNMKCDYCPNCGARMRGGDGDASD